MIPSKTTFILLWLILFSALIPALLPEYTMLWLQSMAIISLLLIIDAIQLLRSPSLDITRSMPNSISLGVQQNIQLTIQNTTKRNIKIQIFDHHPVDCDVVAQPITINISKNQHANITYLITPKKRGQHHFGLTQYRLYSALGLWKNNKHSGQAQTIHVYPNFSVVSHYMLLATDNRLSQIGIRKKRRRGEGMNFHQLREYREGDSTRQIDWKATSRVKKLISREYQDERDQEVLFLIDCGRRMLTQDDKLSHFDHTLNSVLLLTYVALRQGDAVGFGTFSGNDDRWLAANKGLATTDRILNALYDLQPSSQSPDYAQAAFNLMSHQRKRALVIVLTNLRDEDASDLLPALKLLQKKHLVVLASLKEQAIDNALHDEVNTFEDALQYTATIEYLSNRQKAFEKIRSHGINCLDVTPNNLPTSLVNRYLDIKAAGSL